MAKVVVPGQTSTEVYAGGAGGVIIANGGSSILNLNTADPSTAGGAIELASGDAVVFDAGSAWAAATWFGWSEVGTTAVTTVV